MNAWSRQRFNRPVIELTRFDAIYLLSLGPMGFGCVRCSISNATTEIFQSLGIGSEPVIPAFTCMSSRQAGKKRPGHIDYGAASPKKFTSSCDPKAVGST
jgi:hypothetical protein